MNASLLLGLLLVVLALVGLVVGRRFTPRQRASPPREATREPARQETGKSRLTIISELAGIVGAVIAIIGLLIR
jgi:hypothetical protein